MRRNTKQLLILAAALASLGSVVAGDLNPPGAPAPTMVTLQQIFDRQKKSDTCFDNSGRNRFVECGAAGFGTSNGAVKDVQTGLIWLKNASCLGITNWADANIKAANLASGQCGLTDGSQPGDWRLPTKAEWDAIIVPGCYPTPGGPVLPDKLGTGCYASGTQWATGAQANLYWSTTNYTVADPDFAMVGNLSSGIPAWVFKASPTYAWPVRDGR